MKIVDYLEYFFTEAKNFCYSVLRVSANEETNADERKSKTLGDYILDFD